MPQEIRKARVQLTPDQRREYAKLMVDENYTNKAVMELSGAGATAVTRWKKQYIAEQQGDFVEGKIPLDADKRRIQELEKQLTEARDDVRLLKKATALFIRDNPALK